MTSQQQLRANRLNAVRSTGPRSKAGKLRSRMNAIRHGLTAETVITTHEDADEYRRFEAAIVSDYPKRSAVEAQLVLRLVSVLWRLRRATAIETGLLQIHQAKLNRHTIQTRRLICQSCIAPFPSLDHLVGTLCSLQPETLFPSMASKPRRTQRSSQDAS
jgi:hypothetical protein